MFCVLYLPVCSAVTRSPFCAWCSSCSLGCRSGVKSSLLFLPLSCCFFCLLGFVAWLTCVSALPSRESRSSRHGFPPPAALHRALCRSHFSQRPAERHRCGGGDGGGGGFCRSTASTERGGTRDTLTPADVGIDIFHGAPGGRQRSLAVRCHGRPRRRCRWQRIAVSRSFGGPRNGGGGGICHDSDGVEGRGSWRRRRLGFHRRGPVRQLPTLLGGGCCGPERRGPAGGGGDRPRGALRKERRGPG